MATPENFVKVWGYLALMYPLAFKGIKQDQVDTMYVGYLDALEDMPDDGLMAAALKHVRVSRFFPTVAELRDLAYDLLGPAWQIEYVRENGGGWGTRELMSKARARIGLSIEGRDEMELIAEHSVTRDEP